MELSNRIGISLFWHMLAKKRTIFNYREVTCICNFLHYVFKKNHQYIWRKPYCSFITTVFIDGLHLWHGSCVHFLKSFHVICSKLFLGKLRSTFCQKLTEKFNLIHIFEISESDWIIFLHTELSFCTKRWQFFKQIRVNKRLSYDIQGTNNAHVVVGYLQSSIYI